MAHSETLGWGACNCCGGQVAVKLNRSNLAYYRCDHCGFEGRHHWHKTSDKLAAQFAPAAGEGGDEVVPKPAPAAPRKPAETKPPKPAAPVGGLAGLLGLGG